MTGAASHVVLDRVTGFGAKWLELVKEIAPRVRRVGFMFHSGMSPYSALFYRSLETAAQNLAVEPVVAAVRQSADIESNSKLDLRRFYYPNLVQDPWHVAEIPGASHGIDGKDAHQRRQRPGDRGLRHPSAGRGGDLSPDLGADGRGGGAEIVRVTRRRGGREVGVQAATTGASAGRRPGRRLRLERVANGLGERLGWRFDDR